MKFIETGISGVYIVEPHIFRDNRGCFFETYNESEFYRNGITNHFVQDNQSESVYGVVRGLHCQLGKYSQAKLVRVLMGKVLDVVVDVRRESPTFGQYVSVELSDENKRQLFVPRHFLHGFAVLSEKVIFAYKCDNFYNKDSEFTVRHDDADIGIDWPIPKDRIILSEKDKSAKSLKDLPLNEQ